MNREVLPARSYRLETIAIRVAVAALLVFATALASGCTPTQRKATLAVTSTTLIAADWYQSRGYVMSGREDNPALTSGVPADVYFPIVIAANLALGYYLGEGSFGVVTGVEGHAVVRNILTP